MARAQWKGFPGFTAHVTGKVDGRPFEGDVTIDAAGAVHLETQEEVVAPWIQERLESIVLHRNARPQDQAAERSKPVLRFADQEEDHPLGRLLVSERGRVASRYRAK